MVQKTISLSEQAYKLLKKEKRKGESFNNVIERLLSPKEDPWLTMRDHFDPELWEGLKEKLRNDREKNLIGSER